MVLPSTYVKYRNTIKWYCDPAGSRVPGGMDINLLVGYSIEDLGLGHVRPVRKEGDGYTEICNKTFFDEKMYSKHAIEMMDMILDDINKRKRELNSAVTEQMNAMYR